MWQKRLTKINECLSQTRIAHEVGMSQNWVSSVIRGRIKTVRHDVGEKIIRLEAKTDRLVKKLREAA